MTNRPPSGHVSDLVQRMFADVFNDEERAELLVLVRDWDAAHPDATPADRVTGWIDVAYAYQAAREPAPVPKPQTRPRRPRRGALPDATA